jgi:tetratricopeptide (TPR) repeat protein
MKATALFVVPLLVLAVNSVQGQGAPVSTQQASTAAVQTATMTPRQNTELHGDILMAEKDFSGAARTYEGILDGHESDSHLLNKIGVAYEQENALREAEHYFKRASKADKTFMSPLNNLGTIEYSKRNYNKAISYYLKAVKLRDDMGTVYSNLGYAYFEKKDFSLAMDSFEKAIEIDPEVFSHHGGTGSLLQHRTATDPGLFYFLVAKSYAEAGNAEEAAHYLKAARDAEYKEFLTAQTDPAFAKVIKDPRVQEVLVVPPSYAGNRKTVQN